MLKNILTVLRGTVAGQIIGFLALPVLSRLYSPEAFGDFQLFQSVLVLLLVTAALRFEIALLQAAEGPEFANTLQLCAIINIAVAGLVAVACWSATWFPGLVSPGMQRVLWFLPPGLLLGGIAQTLSYLMLRKKAFRLSATAKIAQVGGYVGSAVGIGFALPIQSGLVVGDLFGKLCSVLVICTQRSLFDPACFVRPAKGALRRMARKFREFPLVSVPGGLINAAGGVMTSILMYGSFDAAISGQYGLTERSLMLPVGMLAGAVAQVFTADLSASVRAGGGDALALFRGVVRKMFLLSLAPALIVGLFAPLIFDVAFGPNWALAGEFARMMAPLMMASLIMGSVNMALLVLGWQRLQLLWEIGRLAMVSLSWIIVASFGIDPKGAIALHVAANVGANLLYLWIADRKLRSHAVAPARTAPVASQITHPTRG
jgi:O-antigen/teichoic acid export membrane protein